jgi:FSR family fosmidomycin resistance protein-like MFS transporter
MYKPASPRAQILWLTVTHGVVDAYALSVPFILPILLDRVAPENYRAFFAGAFAATGAASTSIGQVGFAWLADRGVKAPFLWLGIGTAAVGMSLLGVAPNLPVAFLLMLVGGLGVAAFHPQSAVAAARLSQGARGFGMSVFIFGGNVGQAAGPLLLILAYAAWSTAVFAPAMVVGLALCVIFGRMYVSIARDSTSKGVTGPFWSRALFVLYLIVTVRTLTVIGLLNFMSLYLDQEMALTDTRRALVLSGFILCGSVGMLLGGPLSDRFSRLPLLLVSLILPTPIFLLALRAEGFAFPLLLLAANFLLQLTTPLYILLGQETMDRPSNLATSFVMGGAWGTAGLLQLPIGAVANSVGLAPVLSGLSLLPAAAALLLPFLPRAIVGVRPAQGA